MMRTIAILAACSVVWLAGCASKGGNAYVDPALDADTLAADAIAVLGVTSLAGPDDLDTRIVYRETLGGALAQTRPDLRWIEASETWIALGPDVATSILDAYRSTARLGPAQIRELSVLTDRARYVALARIDLDLERLDTDHSPRETLDRIVVDVDVRARREMSCTFDLFDLQEGRLVFTTLRNRVETNTGRSFEVDPLVQPPDTADIDRAIREALPTIPLPEAPARVVLLRRMAQDAAEELPGSP